MSAADKPSEYLKRTCLICGCNTNQTINIYEPRSGPNIVELIQAKFKFQPLNEDKYLCFSCNNWLINWHSLQANNSNDAESPSGTFRSSQVNGGIAHEKRALNLAEPQEKQRTIATCRPIAQVRPRQLLKATKEETKNSEHQRTNTTSSTLSKRYAKYYYAKRTFSSRCIYRLQKAGMKHLSACFICGRPIVLCMRSVTGSLKPIRQLKRNAKCRKCRTVYQWRSIYSSLKSFKIQQLPPSPLPSSRATAAATTTITPKSLVNNNVITQNNFNTHQHQNYNSQCLKRPLVDGKVVAMLRRLGTTLSRECPTNVNAQQLPPIMSPVKPKPRWSRPLEADEILLNFETAISEVLPISTELLSSRTDIQLKQTSIRKKLTYQMSCEQKTESKDKVEIEEISADYQGILNTLPKGLNISLI